MVAVVFFNCHRLLANDSSEQMASSEDQIHRELKSNPPSYRSALHPMPALPHLRGELQEDKRVFSMSSALSPWSIQLALTPGSPSE